MTLSPTEVPLWERRFRAPRISLPDSARDEPNRSVYVSNVTGTYQVWAWDRAAGSHRQVTARPHGTVDAVLPPGGESVWWFDDTDGDEFGTWMRQPFSGGPDEPALPGVPAAYPAGLEIGSTVTVVGCADDQGCAVWLVDGDGPRLLYSGPEDADVAGLSRDEDLVALEHSEHGDSQHKALRVLRCDGTTVADLWDGPGLGLSVLGFSPVPGDSRLLCVHDRTGRPRPFLWDSVAGTQVELPLDDVPGDLEADWYDDGAALLVVSEHRGRSTLHRLELATGARTPLPTPPGTVEAAAPRPDGSVEFSWSSAAEPPVVRCTSGAVVLAAPGTPPPPSVPVQDVVVGDVHALLAVPAGSGPFPLVVLVHGGPTWHDSDAFAADRAAWVDLGCAVVQVNYRGSTGYGAAWRDAIIGRPGLTELEDIAAVRSHLVASGVADAARCAIAGGSWGGYLTLLALGVQPRDWAVGIAAVPVADYVAAYQDEMEPLRAFDRALFLGSPAEVPAAYDAASPLTYLDDVRAPVLVLAGANDPRCPIRQIENWLAAARTRGKQVELYRYDAGHGSLVVEERVRQMRAELRFAARHLGLEPPR